ncbi:MAG TPA: hypothetical protein VIR57_20910, partial [Chloroflexota bacterium]
MVTGEPAALAAMASGLPPMKASMWPATSSLMPLLALMLCISAFRPFWANRLACWVIQTGALPSTFWLAARRVAAVAGPAEVTGTRDAAGAAPPRAARKATATQTPSSLTLALSRRGGRGD